MGAFSMTTLRSARQDLTLSIFTTLFLAPALIAQTEIGAAAPDFALVDHQGNTIKLAELRGRIVVLEWFYDACPFVKAHHAPQRRTMVDLASKYKARQVVWLAVNSTAKQDVKHNAQAAAKLGIPYPILDDHEGKLGRALGARTTPHMFIIDPAGKLVYSGGIDDNPDEPKVNYVDLALQDLLAGRPVKHAQTLPYGCAVRYGRTE
jgi:peroxiredoxin